MYFYHASHVLIFTNIQESKAGNPFDYSQNKNLNDKQCTYIVLNQLTKKSFKCQIYGIPWMQEIYENGLLESKTPHCALF